VIGHNTSTNLPLHAVAEELPWLMRF
jgi:hypothetical protein